MGPVLRSANRRKPSLARQHSIHRSRSFAKRETAFDTLRQRQLNKKSSRQAFSRPPQAKPRKVVALKAPVAQHQAPLARAELSASGATRKRKTAAAPRQWTAPTRTARRQLSTPGPSSPARPRPSPVQRRAAGLQSLEVPTGPRPPRRNNQPAGSAQANRRSLTLRLADDCPTDEQVARLIWKQRDVPLDIEGMSEEERANFLGAVEDGTWNVGFNESQLGWAALIANGKPPGMDVGRFIAHILKGARSKHQVPSDEMMAFESVDYLKRLLVQQNAIAIAAEGLVEKMTIEMKRERDGRIKAEQRAAKAEEALRNAGNRMRVDDDEHEELQLVCREEVEDGIRNDFEDNYPDLEDANNLALLPNSPSTCYVLLRESRKLQGMLSNATISPALLQAAIMNTMGIVTDILGAPTHHPPDHSTKVQLRQTFRIASSTVTICVRALSHLCRDIPGRQPQYKGPVIYQICTIFKRELEQNTKLCQKVADEAYRIYRDHLPMVQRRVLSGLELHEVDVPYLASCRSEFLASVFMSKEFGKTPRPTCFVELLEGLSAELYTKVGNLISETVFKESVTNSHLPGRLSLITVDGRADEVNVLAVAIERDQVLKMLRVVVNRLSTLATKDVTENGAADHLAQLISTEKLLVGPGNHGRWLKIAKEKLQQTLCNAVFGEDNGEFAQALKGAAWDDEWGDVLAGGQKEKVVNDDGEEFVQGIWEIVGWDILEGI